MRLVQACGHDHVWRLYCRNRDHYYHRLEFHTHSQDGGHRISLVSPGMLFRYGCNGLSVWPEILSHSIPDKAHDLLGGRRISYVFPDGMVKKILWRADDHRPPREYIAVDAVWIPGI